MKKISIFFVLVTTVLVSCKKSSSGSSSPHMNATIGGTAKTFNVVAPVAGKQTNGSQTIITVTGVASTSTGESLILEIDNSTSGKSIVAGTYVDTAANFAVNASYAANQTTGYACGTSVAGGGATIKNHFKIVISSIDATAIQGTFSGDLFANGDPSTPPKSMTSGDFYAKFQ